MWLLLTLAILGQPIQAGSDYRQAYSAYQLARNQHVQYGTAATRTAAFDSTKKVLQARNNWQIAYLAYLKSSLESGLGSDIEAEITTLNSTDLTSGDTVEAINASSKTWEDRLKQSDKLVAAVQAQIVVSQLTRLQDRVATLVTSTNSDDTTTLNLIRQKLQISIDLSRKSSALSQSKQALLDSVMLLSQLHAQ